jgi:hypothetical protein
LENHDTPARCNCRARSYHGKPGARALSSAIDQKHRAAIIFFSRLPRTLRAVVPRYFFHFSDGRRRFSDAIGQDLSGIAAARRHAVAQVRELKIAMCHPGIQDLSGWTLVVTDESGKTVFELAFDNRAGGRLSASEL